MARLLILLALSGLVYVSRARLVELRVRAPGNSESDDNQIDEVMYLPNGEGLKTMSFGYDNVLAHLLWFQAINYFGKHFNTDRNYRWLDHMCDLVTTLNPKAKHTYLFCSTMLSWEAELPESSVKLLTRAHDNYPDDWYFPYLRGFTKMYFLGDERGAIDDFVFASSLPDAHPLVKRLAAKKMVQLQDPNTAVEFLAQMIRLERDPQARKALEDRLMGAEQERDLAILNRAVDVFVQMKGKQIERLEDLVTSGILHAIPLNPYDGEYRLQGDPPRVSSSVDSGLSSKTKTHVSASTK